MDNTESGNFTHQSSKHNSRAVSMDFSRLTSQDAKNSEDQITEMNRKQHTSHGTGFESQKQHTWPTPGNGDPRFTTTGSCRTLRTEQSMIVCIPQNDDDAAVLNMNCKSRSLLEPLLHTTDCVLHKCNGNAILNHSHASSPALSDQHSTPHMNPSSPYDESKTLSMHPSLGRFTATSDVPPTPLNITYSPRHHFSPKEKSRYNLTYQQKQRHVLILTICNGTSKQCLQSQL